MPVFEEEQPQIWKCIFVVDLSQAQTECFWLTQMKDDPLWVMSGGDSKAVVLPKHWGYINEMQHKTTSLLVIADNNVTYSDWLCCHKIAFFPNL